MNTPGPVSDWVLPGFRGFGVIGFVVYEILMKQGSCRGGGGAWWEGGGWEMMNTWTGGTTCTHQDW